MEEDEHGENEAGHGSMGMGLCSRCGEHAVAEDPLFSSFVCTNCGNVEEELALRHNVEGEAMQTVRADKPLKVLFSSIPSGSHGLRLARSEQSEDRLGSVKALNKMVASLKLPQHLCEQMRECLRQVVEDEALKRCKSEMLAASCVYFVCRREQRPLTLEQIATSQGLKMREVASLFRKVSSKLKATAAPLPTPKPKVFVQNVCDKLKLAHPIPETARKIIKFAKEAWLEAGRMPLPIAVAAVVLAMEVHNQKMKKAEVVKSCEQLGVKHCTVKDRLAEIRAAFVASSASLPWAKTVTKDNLAVFVPYVLQNVVRKSKDERPPLAKVTYAPPCFRVSQQARERRQAKLLRAKARLRRTILNYPNLATKLRKDVLVKLEKPAEEEAQLPAPETPLDDEDVMIERLLLVGVPDVTILDGYYHTARQLSAAESSIPLDSEHLTEADIPDAEMGKFIRRPDEVRALSDERPAKKPRAPLAASSEPSQSAPPAAAGAAAVAEGDM